MDDKNNNHLGKKPKASTNTMTKSLMSLRNLVNDVVGEELQTQDSDLSKNGETDNEKLEEHVNLPINEDDSEIKALLKMLEPLNKQAITPGSTVTVRISKKMHRILSELKLDDDFENCRYGDILEALFLLFIERNKKELKKRISKRKSSF